MRTKQIKSNLRAEKKRNGKNEGRRKEKTDLIQYDMVAYVCMFSG